MHPRKYQIWDKQNNRFFKPKYEAYKGELEELFMLPSGDLVMRKMECGVVVTKHESTFLDRFIVRWFTGLHDKNGKEIYEGDIVALIVDDDIRHFEVAIQTVIREVVSHPSFDDATAKVAITGVVFKWKGYELFPCVNKGIHDNEKMEVVGNIYQNPELRRAA